jgi:galactokinase
MADEKVSWDKQKIGELAYKAEVTEFQEPGGMMDQYSTAIGDLLYIASEPSMDIQPLDASLGSFVLGDSKEPKETLEILKKCRDVRLELFNTIRLKNEAFDLHSYDMDLDLSGLDHEERTLFHGTIRNRDILIKARSELNKSSPDHQLIGSLLNDHHAILRDHLHVSTTKIEAMLSSAINAGAFGGKINGSGGGGCMFAYAPEDPESVARAIESVGGKAYIIYADDGTKALT